MGIADDARLPTDQRLVGIASTIDFPVQFGSFPGQSNPTVRWDVSLRETAAVMTRTEGRPGAASVVDAQGKLIGIFTDGDLRRLVQRGEVDFARPVSAVMGKSPRTVGPDDLATSAAEMLRHSQVDQLPVVDDVGRPVGLLDVQDLLAARLLG